MDASKLLYESLLSIFLITVLFVFLQIPHFDSGGREHWPAEDGAFLHSRCVASDGTFVHGLYDLYSDMSGGSWDQLLEKHMLNDGQSKFPREKTAPSDKIRRRSMVQGVALAESFQNKDMEAHRNFFQEEVDYGSESLSANSSSELESVGGASKGVAYKDTAEKVVLGFISFLSLGESICL